MAIILLNLKSVLPLQKVFLHLLSNLNLEQQLLLLMIELQVQVLVSLLFIAIPTFVFIFIYILFVYFLQNSYFSQQLETYIAILYVARMGRSTQGVTASVIFYCTEEDLAAQLWNYVLQHQPMFNVHIIQRACVYMHMHKHIVVTKIRICKPT